MTITYRSIETDEGWRRVYDLSALTPEQRCLARKVYRRMREGYHRRGEAIWITLSCLDAASEVANV